MNRAADRGGVVRSRLALAAMVIAVCVLGAVSRSDAHSGQVIWQGQSSPVSFVFIPTDPRVQAIELLDGIAYRVDMASADGWTSQRNAKGVKVEGPPASHTVTLKLQVTALNLGHLEIPYRLTFADRTVEENVGPKSLHFTVFDPSKRGGSVAPPAVLALDSPAGNGISFPPALVGILALAATAALFAFRKRHSPR